MGDNNATERVTETVQEGRQNSSVVAGCDEVEGNHDCYNKVHREPPTETATSSVERDRSGAQLIKRDDRRLEDDAIEQRLGAFIQEGQYFAARRLLKKVVSAERRSAWETYLNGAESELRVMQIDRFVEQGRYWEAHLEAACIRDAELRQQWRAYTNALYWQAQDYPEEVVNELDVPCQEVVYLPIAAAASPMTAAPCPFVAEQSYP